MFKYFENINNYFWYLKTRNKMRKHLEYANMNLVYFASVRRNNMLRQQIGRQDLSCIKLPAIRGTGKTMLSCSEDCMFRIIEVANRELAKLDRWLRFKHISKNPITGRVIFT